MIQDQIYCTLSLFERIKEVEPIDLVDIFYKKYFISVNETDKLSLVNSKQIKKRCIMSKFENKIVLAVAIDYNENDQSKFQY